MNKRPLLISLAYTNHALDQFLENIYDEVTTEIIRCGSRSKSEKIQAVSGVAPLDASVS
jgi:hypothetical protein